jgi:hypothetical protein
VAVAAFMAKHRILYKALRPLFVKLVREDAPGTGFGVSGEGHPSPARLAWSETA